MKKKTINIATVYLLGFIILYATFAYIYLYKIRNENRISLNTEIPDFKLENQFGEFKSIKDYKGKYVLVDFWFAGCKPCIKEMQYFPELLKKYESNLSIISVSIDSKEVTKRLLETKKKPFDFLVNDNNDWVFLNDPMKKENSYVKTLKITTYPSYLLFDTEGRFIASPASGIAKVEHELGGFFTMNLTLKSNKSHFIKFFVLIIPYTLIFVIGMLIYTFRIGSIKKRRRTFS